MATGRDALGSLPVHRPGRVLYFALEDGEARLRGTIEAILGRAPLDSLTLVHELPFRLS